MDSWMTIIAWIGVAVAGRVAIWKVCCMTLVVTTGYWFINYRCPGNNGLKGSLDKAHKGLEVRQACTSATMCKVPSRWQPCVLLTWCFMDVASAFLLLVRSTRRDESPSHPSVVKKSCILAIWDEDRNI